MEREGEFEVKFRPERYHEGMYFSFSVELQ